MFFPFFFAGESHDKQIFFPQKIQGPIYGSSGVCRSPWRWHQRSSIHDIYDILLHDIVCKYMMIMMYMIPSAQARQSWSRCAPPSATAGTSGAMAGSWGVWMVKPMGKMVIFHGFVDLRKGLRGWMCGFIWLYNVSYIYIYIHTRKNNCL